MILPSLEAADRISSQLEDLGMNIRSDGRPILGLDSYRLFDLILKACPDVIYIPAHIWTPHFSIFGSNSGFDTIEECFEDLTPYIHALETGLSSNPGMNWRWSELDRFTLVSNSDAHNPQNLAREANIFNCECSYFGIKQALQDKVSGGFEGTLEFFPEEGKYHLDGHRNCEITLQPEETKTRNGICPACGRKVTVGVLHRVADLADRPEGACPSGASPYQCLVPLREVIASAMAQGPTTRKVIQRYFELLHQFGPELVVLREVAIDEIAMVAGPLIAEGIRRLRIGQVMIKPGYDGEYGVISVLSETDRLALQGQAALFDSEAALHKKEVQLREAVAEVVEKARSFVDPGEIENLPLTKGLSVEQQSIITADYRSVIVIASREPGRPKR